MFKYNIYTNVKNVPFSFVIFEISKHFKNHVTIFDKLLQNYIVYVN